MIDKVEDKLNQINNEIKKEEEEYQLSQEDIYVEEAFREWYFNSF